MTRLGITRKAVRDLRFILRTAERGAPPPPARDWLLDNRYLAERECGLAVNELRGARLSRASSERVTDSAAHCLDACGGVVTETRLEPPLGECALRECELNAFLPALRLAIADKLALLCGQSGADVDAEEMAERFAALFTSLRYLATFDASELLERVNAVEQILLRDPAHVYAAMDEDSRRDYRTAVAELAKRHGIEESEAAERVLRLAESDGAHVGEYIYTKPLGNAAKRRTGKTYVALIITLSLAASVCAACCSGLWALFPLTLLPISEIAVRVLDFFASKLLHARRTPRLALKDGIPDGAKTVAVVSILLSKPESCVRAAELLEEYRLANRDSGANLLFGLLADLPESKTETQPSDGEITGAASEAVARLNEKYGGGFYLLLRPRTFRERDNVWCGRERKRGAIEDLAKLLRGKPSDMRVVAGDAERLTGAKYILTLDADTRLTAGSARELVGAMLHPLAKPDTDERTNVVTRGFAIMQPRVVTELSDAAGSELSRIFCGGGGLDPYGGSSGDVYPALTGSACSFIGKGIIDADIYLRVMEKRLPDNRILSHDLIEGSYLRCGCVGDVELTDGHPTAPAPYYTRAHRWIRGDWQIARWVFTRDGISALDRWKIFDNLRRSLLPIAAGACFFTAALDARYLVAAIVAFAALVSGDLLHFLSTLPRRRDRTRRYFSFVPDGSGTPLARCLARLLLLPADASVCLRAISSALWRVCVTKRRLLEWTTAADAELKRGGIAACLRLTFPTFAVAVAAFFLSPYAPAKAFALIWALSPLYMCALGNHAKRERVPVPPPPELHAYTADIWRFFDTFLTESDNFLPPDNYQESPDGVLARRTSPTNIGLSLLSCLAAHDLGLIDRERALSLIGSTLRTVDKLDKWRGHLYNWYDTENLDVLPPRYVSTVDSGNFAACLAALKQGLDELGDENFASLADKIYRETDFSALYDKRRRLFLIGYDAGSDEYSDSAYDLMASEAMLTSYTAIARGDVPRKHWRTLSRAQVAVSGYRGMASWTGTMFEYLMPYLLLPLPEHSLLYESARFCLYAQKRASIRGVWGMSESAYGALTGGAYRYKAHGVQQLALKRGMDADAVLAPYASFLALTLDPYGAAENLRRFADMGAYGEYGFCEAVDFTPERTRNGALVKTYMAHHLGMSLISACNLLTDGVMRRRFTRDADMRAYLELLRESVPRGGAVISNRGRAFADIPDRTETHNDAEIRSIDAFLPQCAALSDKRGRWTVMMSATGQNVSKYGENTLTRNEFDASARHSGVIFFLRTENALIPLQPAPFIATDATHSARFDGGSATLITRCGAFTATVTTRVANDGTGETRTVEITSRKPLRGEVLCYFEPVLSPVADYLSHPAFSKLSLESVTHSNTLTVTRRPRGNERGLSLAVTSSVESQYETSRERALGRNGFASLSVPRVVVNGGEVTAALDPCVLAVAPFELTDAPKKITFAFAADEDAEHAAVAVEKLLQSSAKPSQEPQPDEFTTALLPRLLYDAPDRRLDPALYDALSLGRNGLWSLGISGDYPIIACDLDECGETSAPRDLVAAHAYLKKRGVAFDLVFLTDEGGDDYRAPRRETVASHLREYGCEHALNARGGIFVVQKSVDAAELVLALAKRVFPADETSVPVRKRTYEPLRRKLCGAEPPYGWNDDDAFWFDTTDNLPPGAWSHVLANNAFGSLVTDAGTGHMWRKNARENKISDWLNDALTTTGTERAFAIVNGVRASLFSAPDGLPCRVTFGFGYAVWEKNIGGVTVKTTLFVPKNSSARAMLVETSAPATIEYCADLELSDGTGGGTTVVTERRGNAVYAHNPYNTDFGTSLALCSSAPVDAFTCSRAAYLAGEYDGTAGAGFLSCAAVKITVNGTAVLAIGEPDDARELCSTDRARSLLDATVSHWREITGAVRLKSKHGALDRYVNGWAIYQTLCCRHYARASLYQCGGAYGFRDQLQDVCAVAYVQPDIVREHILRCSSRQFLEGDVQHWWHPGTGRNGRGVRTRCSDDLLWLPETVCEYMKLTGDATVLDEVTPFLTSPPLTDGEHERYEDPGVSGEYADVYEHCKRAVDLVIERGVGSHGLCLIGGGDWNDGMNLVGAEGRGESVWLTWFFARVARRFADIAQSRGDNGFAERCISVADERAAAANGAWDGAWFLRGWFDDGSPLGASTCVECRLDSIAQSFAVFGGGDADKTKTALKSAYDMLYDRETRIVKLFDPPFKDGGASPGYIKGYSPGFRENGGQYTHGAVWLGYALLLADDMRDEGWNVLRAILPSERDASRYRTEPYVLPADVYSNASHVGRGGWTWYTGAAGWYLRAVIESLLGVDITNGHVTCSPRVPEDFGDFTLTVKNGGKTYEIRRKNGEVEVKES